MTRRAPERRRARLARLLLCVAASLGDPAMARVAYAQTAPVLTPQNLPMRDASFAWDGDLLRAGFSWTDVLEDPLVRSKLSNGTANTITMRAIVFRDGDPTPITAALQTCTVTLDIWSDAYTLQIDSAAGTRHLAAPNLVGVERYCGKVQDFPIVSRAVLRPGVAHFLGVIVDVNPVNDQMKAQMQSWMRRPLGSSDVSGGSSVFSGLVLLFMRDVGGSDRTLQFRTKTFIPS